MGEEIHMIRIADRKQCCGCSACAAICPADAIKMKPDGMGFRYPVVDRDKCIECGRCEKVCAFNDHYDRSLHLEAPVTYAARAEDPEELARSQSGGVSYLLMKRVLQAGGIVYGAGFVDHFRVAHKRAEDLEQAQEFRLRKYVQRDPGQTFRQTLADLKSGRNVLFTGTPCQTAGLHAFVGPKYRESLWLQDIVCHGVPAPNVWRDYLTFRERKAGRAATALLFRDPACGWHTHRETVRFGKARATSGDYSRLYHKALMSRPSCGVCPYAYLHRPSDLTCGDCWGIESVDKNFAGDGLAASLILVNTRKGENLFSQVLPEMQVLPVNIDRLLQLNLCRPTPPAAESEAFEREYLNGGFESIRKEFMVPTLKERFAAWKWRVKRSEIGKRFLSTLQGFPFRSLFLKKKRG